MARPHYLLKYFIYFFVLYFLESHRVDTQEPPATNHQGVYFRL